VHGRKQRTLLPRIKVGKSPAYLGHNSILQHKKGL
jgi:hypothetical protein